MTKKVNPIPAGYHSITPYLFVKDAANAIEFYKKALEAIEISRMSLPDGKVGHAELKIGDSRIMLSDEYPEMKAISPQALGGSTISLVLYVENVDVIAKKMIDAGAKVIKPVEDQFYGDRMGSFSDPFGHLWTISTHIEDVSDEECKIRFEKMLKENQ